MNIQDLDLARDLRSSYSEKRNLVSILKDSIEHGNQMFISTKFSKFDMSNDMKRAVLELAEKELADIIKQIESL